MRDETTSRIDDDASGHVRHVDIEWGPTIDAEACTGCGVCIDFCHHDVYQWSEEESKVIVAQAALRARLLALRDAVRCPGDLVSHAGGDQARPPGCLRSHSRPAA